MKFPRRAREIVGCTLTENNFPLDFENLKLNFSTQNLPETTPKYLILIELHQKTYNF